MRKLWVRVPKPNSQYLLVVIHIQATLPLSAPKCPWGIVLLSPPGEVNW